MQKQKGAQFQNYSPDSDQTPQPINLKDFETFEPRESQLHEEQSQASSVVLQKVQRRLNDDMHLELDDLEMPNNSMTLSSLSQSQWQGRSMRSYISNISQLPLGHGTANSLESSQLPSGRHQDSNSNLTMSNSHSHQFGTEEKRSHEDSPDFNRPHQESLVSVTDELTVSKSDLAISEMKSYRHDFGDQPVMRNQNRTFADSVMDHQLQGVKSQNAFTALKSSHLRPQPKQSSEDQLSDSISDLDLLTKTQISAHQFKEPIDQNARSHIMIPQLLNESLTHSQITSNDQHTKRTTPNNLFRQLLLDQSTPEKSDSDSLNWHLKPSAPQPLQQPQTAPMEDNPISQLKERIKQSNMQKRRDSRDRPRSLADQELYEALDAEPQPRQIQPALLLANQGQAGARVRELEEQNRHLAKSCQVLQQQLQEAQKQSQSKPIDKQELLRVRALEATRQELKETQRTLDEKENLLQALQRRVIELESYKQSGEGKLQQMKEEFDLQLDKQKIIISGLKRDSQSHQSDLQQELNNLREKCLILENEAKDAREQAAQTQRKMQHKIQSMQESLQIRDSEIKSLESKLDALNMECSRIDSQRQGTETELLQYKQQCNQLQKDLDLIGERQRENNTFSLAGARGSFSQSQGFDQELRRMKDVHQTQISKLETQLSSLQTHLADKTLEVQRLQAMVHPEPAPIECCHQPLLDRLLALLDLADTEELPDKCQTLASVQKQSSQKLEETRTQLLHERRSSQTERAKLLQEVQTLQERVREMERLLEEREQPSNYTKNLLLQKDMDNQALQKELDDVKEQKWHSDQATAAMEAKVGLLENDKVQLQQEIAHQRRLRLESVRELENQKSVAVPLTIQQWFSERHGIELSSGDLCSQLEQLGDGTELQKAKDALASKELELESMHQTCERQQAVIGKLEKQVLGVAFLEVLDAVVEGNCNDNSELAQQIKQRIQHLKGCEDNDLSHITNEAEEGNPLQDKSGKHEAMLFLSHLQPTQSQLGRLQQETQTDAWEMDSLRLQLQEKEAQFGQLHQQMMSELQLKSDEMDIESQQIQQERNNHQTQLAQLRKELEQQFETQLKHMQEQSEFKLQEQEISFQRRLEDQLQESISSARTNQNQRQEKLESQLQQLRLKEKEARQQLESIKKQHAERVQQLSKEHQQTLDNVQQANNEATVELQKALAAKQKQAVDQACQKVRVELMNKLSEAKNEHSKQQAEWQRQQSKHQQVTDERVEEAKAQLAQEHQKEILQAKTIVERMWKKKLDEQGKRLQQEVRDIEGQLEEAEVRQREELRKQSKQWQQKLKDLQTTYEQDALDRPHKTTQDVQCSPMPPRSPDRNLPLQSNSAARPAICKDCAHLHALNSQQTQFIEQLKLNFEHELYKIDQQHVQALTQATHSLEQVLCLELDKILKTLHSKQQQDQDQAQKQLLQDRAEINVQIKQLISNQDGKQLKQAFERCKAKFTHVLTTLKGQLDSKYQQKMAQLGMYMTNQTTSLQLEETLISAQPVSKSHETQKMLALVQRQSQDSAEVNLVAKSQEEMIKSPPISHRSPSVRKLEVEPLNKYISYMSPRQSFDQGLNRVAPQSVNQRGNVVVEVEKVCRDIQMLYETTKMAKFSRLLIGTASMDDSAISTSLSSARSQNQQHFVSAYRDLLNYFFKLVAKLNQASDQLCKDQEVFRLRLLNVDLQAQVSALEKEHSGVVTRKVVQDVLGYWQKHASEPSVRSVLDALEQLHFQISKNQFKLNQLVDLFTDMDNRVNLNQQEVRAKCEQFSEQMDTFLESTFPAHNRVEQLSPNETAHLIATVLQRLPSSRKNHTLNQALQMCKDSSSEQHMPPLQGLTQDRHTSHISQKQQIQQRSRSNHAGTNMPRQISEPRSLYQTVSQTSMPQRVQKAARRGSDRYPVVQQSTPEQEELESSSDFNQIDEADSPQKLSQELECAQSNVNQLFEKVQKSRFNTLQY